MSATPTPGGGRPPLWDLLDEHGGAAGLAAAVRSGSVAAGDVLRAAYDRIDLREGDLHAFTQVFRDQPTAAGAPAGALAGLPVAVKDSLDVAGETTSLGLPLAERPRATADADAVARLRSAGAVIVGKTNLPELASSAITVNAHYGDTRNPWDPARTAGGSSGGSGAAVAAGMAVAALGTDTAGSVLLPAAFNGVVGLRPTPGRIHESGVAPLSPTLDTVGVIAREPADVAHVFGVLDTSPAVRPPRATSAAGLRIAVPGGWFRDAEPAALAALDAAAAALEAAGARLIPVELPSTQKAFAQARVVYSAEAARSMTALVRPGGRYAPAVERRRTTDVTRPAYAAARNFRDEWRREVAAVFDGADLLLYATAPGPAPRLDCADEATVTSVLRFTYPLCFAGIPALSLPCGAPDGPPVGVTVAAPSQADAELLDAAVGFRGLGLFGPGTPPEPAR